MASLIPGYEYDIFISYRQKDNKYDGWVTEFVDNLKKELEATFKEEISVYFDINPSDYLLESYDVDASLKDKLKCLVFIPIISRTYCDPKSFAWEHEFKAYIEQASQGHFGLKVKLPNGNVANRVLPVRIHDLDANDIRECESVLGGVLRGVEFIYKEAGIDKPLAPEDNEKKNLNNTTYRIQIIKVAHTIKEIISGLRTTGGSAKEIIQHKEPFEKVKKDEKKEMQAKPLKLAKRRLLSGVIVSIFLFVIAVILAYPKIFKRDTLEDLKVKGEISVAVMPFQNMTNDTTWDVWQVGIQDMLITSLSNSPEELTVRQRESINDLIKSKSLTNYSSITPELARTISQKLDAKVFINGNIKQAGSKLRVYAQLIDTKTKKVFKSFQIEKAAKEEIIFPIIDSLSVIVKDFLLITVLEKEMTKDVRPFVITPSPEAYRFYIYGHQAFYNRDYPTARDWFFQALKLDSNFVSAIIGISYSYGDQGLYEEAKKWSLKSYEYRNRVPVLQQIYIDLNYATYFERPNEEIKFEKRLLEIDDQLPHMYYRLAYSYFKIAQYEKAIPEFKKSLEMYREWGIKPRWIHNYRLLGISYHRTGQFSEEKKLYTEAEMDFPNDPLLIYHQAVLALSEDRSEKANEYINRYITILKGNSVAEAVINNYQAGIYSEAGLLNKAEEYYRQALSLEPDNLAIINSLSYFLIDEGRNVNEGMELIDKALIKSPDNYNYLHTKGWGLYKQQKYKESFDILKKSWDLRLKNGYYSHTSFLHLEEAKKAVANMK